MDKLVNYLCIIQARTNSSRLPAKIMLDLAGKTLLERVYETVSKSNKIDQIIVATSNKVSDDIVEVKLKSLKIECFRGDLNNVLKRFFDATQKYQTKNIIRITADNPLMDHTVIDDLLHHYEQSKSEYSTFSNAIYGLSAEVFSYDALKLAYDNTYDTYDQEHVTPYIRNNCKTIMIDIDKKYKRPESSVTVDTLEDYIKMQQFYLFCKDNNLEHNIDTYLDLYDKKIISGFQHHAF